VTSGVSNGEVVMLAPQPRKVTVSLVRTDVVVWCALPCTVVYTVQVNVKCGLVRGQVQCDAAEQCSSSRKCLCVRFSWRTVRCVANDTSRCTARATPSSAVWCTCVSAVRHDVVALAFMQHFAVVTFWAVVQVLEKEFTVDQNASIASIIPNITKGTLSPTYAHTHTPVPAPQRFYFHELLPCST
jgi:hypothetical protein